MPLPDGSGTEYTSVRIPRLKAARRLTKRALRQRARAFLAEGPQAVTEAFSSGAPVSELFVTAEARARHAELVAAMRFFAERMKMVVEPTGGLGYAAARRMKAELAGRRVGVIISGGNVDLQRYAALLAGGAP